MKNFTLAIVFCSYKEPENDIEYINNVIEKIDERFEFAYLFDGKINKEIKEKINPKIKIIETMENVGKIKGLLIASKKLNSKWIKSIDYDDVINYLDLDCLIKGLEKIKNDTYPKHTAAKIKNDSEFYGKKLIDANEINSALESSFNVNYSRIPNARAIWNSEIIKKIYSLNIERNDYYDDDFFSLAHQLFFKKTVNIDCRPYIQYHAHGQNATKENEVFSDQIKMIENLIKVKEYYGLSSSNLECSSKELFDITVNRLKNHFKSEEKAINFANEAIKKIFD